MQIDITGYVTEQFSNYHFKVKVTSDSVEYLSLNNFQVSKEIRIAILPHLYPLGDHSKFIGLTAQDDPRLNDPHLNEINECLSLGRALREGDQIECSVFIVDPENRAINRNPNDIETYTKFNLWLYPNKDYFRRSESDSRESLKFRKQWRYTCLNREKCRKVTDYAYKYHSRWWINKNPKMIFPIIWEIRVKTAVSNLWGNTEQGKNKSTTINTIVTIIGIVVGVIGIVVGVIGIWVLFFKEP